MARSTSATARVMLGTTAQIPGAVERVHRGHTTLCRAATPATASSVGTVCRVRLGRTRTLPRELLLATCVPLARIWIRQENFSCPSVSRVLLARIKWVGACLIQQIARFAGLGHTKQLHWRCRRQTAHSVRWVRTSPCLAKQHATGVALGGTRLGQAW